MDRDKTSPGFWSRRSLLIIILLLVALLLFFSHAGRKDVHTGDEARTMLIARDMLRAGDWFVPRIQQGRVILTKPPLLFWSIALISALHGGEVTEFTGSLPVALSAMAGIIGLFLLGEQLFNRRTAFLAALILATTPQYFWLAYQYRVDMPLTVSIIFAFWAFYRGYSTPALRSSSSLLFFLFLALGTSCKGPLAVTVPLLPILCFLWWHRELSFLKALRPLRGMVLYALIVLPWFLPALLQQEIDYGKLVVQQTVLRFLHAQDTNAPFYFYVPSLLVNFLPWSLFLPGGIGQGFRLESQRKKPFLLVFLWLVVNFLFFSLSSGKRDRYILPLYPAAALLVALFWEEAIRRGREFLKSQGWRIPVYAFLCLSVLGGVGVLGGTVVRQLDLFPKMNFFFPQAPLFLLLLAGLFWGGGILAYLGYRQEHPLRVWGAIWGMMFALLTLGPFVFFPQYNRSQDVKGFVRELQQVLPPGGKLCGYLFEKLPYNFYLDRRIEQVRDPESLRRFLTTRVPAHCLMEKERYEEVREALPPAVRLLKERVVGRETFVLIGREG